MKAEKNWKNEYVKLRKNLNRYLKANREMVDWMHKHLCDLADTERETYEELCNAEGDAAFKL